MNNEIKPGVGRLCPGLSDILSEQLNVGARRRQLSKPAWATPDVIVGGDYRQTAIL